MGMLFLYADHPETCQTYRNSVYQRELSYQATYMPYIAFPLAQLRLIPKMEAVYIAKAFTMNRIHHRDSSQIERNSRKHDLFMEMFNWFSSRKSKSFKMPPTELSLVGIINTICIIYISCLKMLCSN